MEQLILYNLPYGNTDLIEISRLLRKVDPIVTPWTNFDRYDFFSYAKQRDLHHREFRALFDLNLVSDTIRLYERKAASETMKHTAALLAFLIVTDTQFDVGPATTEQFHKHDDKVANESLRVFWLADNVNPLAYADIALGRRDHLAETEVASGPSTRTQSPRKIHYNWHLHYIALLKLAVMSRTEGTGLSKLMEYMEWMWRDYMLSATAFAFAAIYLSPKPFGKMMKGIGNSDPKRVLDGVRNAAWDLVLVHYWAARVRENWGTKKPLWIFCSLDKALRQIASNLLIDSDSDEAVEEKLILFLSEYWPPEAVRKILIARDAHMKSANDSRRAKSRVKDQTEFLHLVDDLEKQLCVGVKQ